MFLLLPILLLLCSSCTSYVYVNSPWPRIYRTKQVKKTVDFDMKQLDVLGAEKKKKLIDEVVTLVATINSLEASLDGYAKAREKHNAKFKEKVVGKKETP